MSQAGQFLAVSGPGAAVETLTGNLGGPVPPTANNIDILGSDGAIFTGNPGISTLTLSFDFLALPATDIAGDGLISFGGTTYIQQYGTNNFFLGANAGNTTLTVVSAINNNALGSNALASLTTGARNVAIGTPGALRLLTTGSSNIAVGAFSLPSLTTGSDNIGIGDSTGTAYTGAESNNILINNIGLLGESGVIRIGTNGTQTKAFITGIDGVNVGSVATVVTEASDQLGTAVITAGSGITVTPGANTITIAANGSSVIQTITGNTGGPESPSAGNFNIVTFGTNILFEGSANTETLNFNKNNILLGAPGAITSGTDNTALGLLAGASITSGADNTAIGFQALEGSTTSNQCTAIGSFALFHATIGAHNNTGVGYEALGTLTTGAYNTAIGQTAGFSLTTTDSSNVLIANGGTGGDNNTMRLGTTGAGNGQVNRCFLAGVDGVNVGSVAKVLTMASEQVGTATITAGTGISVTPGANTITIAATGTTTLTYTNVNTTPYVVLTTDDFLGVDSSGAPITIQLPNAPATGRVWTIKDRTGSAATNNITVTTVGGAVNIDGATTFVMNTNFESVNVLFDGSTYQIY